MNDDDDDDDDEEEEERMGACVVFHVLVLSTFLFLISSLFFQTLFLFRSTEGTFPIAGLGNVTAGVQGGRDAGA